MRGIRHFSFGQFFQEPGHGEHYLQRVLGLVDEHWFADLDLLIYQAGADVHVDDPLGGILTTEQMRQRDRLVFSIARAKNIPLAWNLAGGYQTPVSKVVALHEQTMDACLALYQV
jgi:acetoin utilization deacetylase AcuC-like enzyme